MDQTIKMLEKYTEYELKVSDLYMLFSRIFPEDSKFWFDLSLEEKDHASLIKSSIVYVRIGKFPSQMAYDCMDSIDSMLDLIDSRIERYSAATPAKCEACRFALIVERSPCETGFLKAMTTETDDRVMQILQKVGRLDALHYTRVDNLMQKFGCSNKDKESD